MVVWRRFLSIDDRHRLWQDPVKYAARLAFQSYFSTDIELDWDSFALFLYHTCAITINGLVIPNPAPPAGVK